MKAPESAEQIANNEDLLTEILLYLPAKSLIKFKAVSKQWMSLISSTGFCLSHACPPRDKGSLKPSALFLDVYHFPPSEFSFLPLTHDCVRLPRFDFIDEPIVMILESCSGLLLCASYDSFPDQSTIRCVAWYPTTGKVKMFPFPSSPRYFICNPTTRKFKMLSFPSSQVEDYEHEAHNLAFDPLKSPHYKIISVWRQKIKEWPVPDRPEYSFDIYSSETNSWSLSKIKFPGDWGIKFNHGVFFKGAVHWYSNCRESHYFDVENECLKRMPMPRVDKVQCQYFGESGGYLNLAIAHSAAKRLKFSVFEMKEDYSDWYLKYRVNLGAEYDTLSRPPFWSSYTYFGEYVLFCAMQSEEGDSLFAVFSDGKAMSYNLKDGILKGPHCPTVGKYGADISVFGPVDTLRPFFVFEICNFLLKPIISRFLIRSYLLFKFSTTWNIINSLYCYITFV